MPLSWNEIKTRAVTFSKEWENKRLFHQIKTDTKK